MSILQEATQALQDLERALLESTAADLDSVQLAERIRLVRYLLSDREAQWIGTTEAKRLLGVRSESTVKAWARLGLVRSRLLPNGRTQVLLDDVLRRREETEGLSAIGGDELTAEELRDLTVSRPGTNPWHRTHTDPDP
jgi:hypothetical protein